MTRILVVDDNPQNLYLLEVLLQGHGFGVSSASNGAEALQAARRDPPDLVVSDILMPVMDGYALCREFKTDESLRDTPFIIYTATFTDPKDEALALTVGAERFLIKPMDPDELMSHVREVLAGSRRAAPKENPDDGSVLREYSETLLRKLEKKMAELEQTNHALETHILEQKNLEAQLRQAQKMEAMGQLAGGIAHDFNNVITAITGYCNILQMKMAPDDRLRAIVDQVMGAADRAGTLTRNLLAFSRNQELKPRPVDLNAIIEKLADFVSRIIGEDIVLETSIRRGVIPILADAGQIEQVVVNLATNARDAMTTAGTLSIGTDIIDIDSDFITVNGFGLPGRYALLTVSDDGAGIEEGIRRKIFDPFFTTKDIGKGTGLGLSIVYGIVTQHKGFITVYSEPGNGTTFKIMFPLMHGEELAEGGKSGVEGRGGSETILFAEDDPGVAASLQTYLEMLGYTVIPARDGDEAVARYRESADSIDLVLLDVVMPHRSGREAAQEIRRERPGARILFASGYPVEIVRSRGLLDEGVEMIMKPLRPADLSRRIREMLEGEAAATQE